MHALGVLDVEVAHGRAALVDDPEREPLGAAAAQLRVLDDDAQAVRGAREPAHVVRGRAVRAARLGAPRAPPGVAGSASAFGSGPDGAAGQRARGEHERQRGAEQQQAEGVCWASMRETVAYP